MAGRLWRCGAGFCGAAEGPGAGLWGAEGLPGPGKPRPLSWSLRAEKMPGSGLVQDILQLPHLTHSTPGQKPWIQILDLPPQPRASPWSEGELKAPSPANISTPTSLPRPGNPLVLSSLHNSLLPLTEARLQQPSSSPHPPLILLHCQLLQKPFPRAFAAALAACSHPNYATTTRSFYN